MTERRFWLAFTLCAAASAVPFLHPGPLPMADLPEHLAQVSIWKALHHPCYRFSEIFELNWFTPYLLGYVLVRAAAALLTVQAAAKVTVYAAIVLMPLSLRALLRRGDGDSWFSLLGFPLAFGFAFYWGFLNFLLVVPFGLFYLAVLYDHSRAPTRRRAVALVLLGLLVLATHALMLVFCAVTALAWALLSRSWRTFAAILAPVAVPLGILAVWVSNVRATDPAVRGATYWNLGWYRLKLLPSTFLSNEWDTAATALSLAIFLVIALTRPHISHDPRRWTILVLASLAYFFAPVSEFGSAFLYARAAVLVFAGALFVLGEPRGSLALARGAVVAIVVVWAAVLASRFHRFSREAAGFDDLVRLLPANRRVLMFNIRPFSDAVPGPVFFHFAAYYQVRKGGLIAWSFARYYPQLVRYKIGREPRVRGKSVPDAPPDWTDVSQYDYVMIRAGTDMGRPLLSHAPYPIKARARSGMWWLYETPRAAIPAAECTPLER